eukprot:COSAG05_NODE_10018_length_588_cov_0.460123_1_plen_163_part_01
MMRPLLATVIATGLGARARVQQASSAVPANLNQSLGITLPAYWSGTGPTMLTTEGSRIAKAAQALQIQLVTSSCCWPAAAERAALQQLRAANVQLLFYVPTLDPAAYRSGKIACCDSFENIARHTEEVFNETQNLQGHVALGHHDGVFFDNGPFVGQEAFYQR